MLYFNELRILEDRKYILIDVLVMDLPYYENVYIKHIEVHTPKTFKPLGFISGNTLVNPLDFTSSLDLSNNDIKHYRGFIPIDGCAGNLFFIVVKVSGGTEVNLPCVTKQDVIVGVTYDKLPIYQKGMKLLSELKGCQSSDDLKDFIFLKKAFDISLLAGNYENVIKYWNLITLNKEAVVIKSCGCHGTI